MVFEWAWRLRDAIRRLFRFKRGELVVNVDIRPQDGGGAQVAVSIYTQPPGTPEPENLRPSWTEMTSALPAKDQPGKDLDFLPRPPKGVRMMGFSVGNSTFLTYTSPLSVLEVRDFYKDALKTTGWEVQFESSMSDVFTTYIKHVDKAQQAKTSAVLGGLVKEAMKDGYVLRLKGEQGKLAISIFKKPTMDASDASVVQIRYDKQ